MADPGLFDLLSPGLSLIDSFMSDTMALAPIWRIVFFAALGSVTSMLLFKVLSNQIELAELKQEIKAVQKVLAKPELESGELQEALLQNLKLTGRQLWLSFWPALIASIPVLFLLAFSSNQYSLETPESDSRVYVTPIGLQDSPMEYDWVGVNAQWDARKKAWTFYTPIPGRSVSLMLNGQKQLGLPSSAPTSVIHGKRWWNYLLANPAGYLDANVNIELFQFNTPTQIIINWGPGWMRGWLFAFMLFLVLFSIAIKTVFKIH